MKLISEFLVKKKQSESQYIDDISIINDKYIVYGMHKETGKSADKIYIIKTGNSLYDLYLKKTQTHTDNVLFRTMDKQLWYLSVLASHLGKHTAEIQFDYSVWAKTTDSLKALLNNAKVPVEIIDLRKK